MYHVRIVHHDGKHHTYPAAHFGFNRIDEDSYSCKSGLDQPGIEVELTMLDEVNGRQYLKMLRLPEDGHTIYIMNEAGNTVDTYRWPPRDDEHDRPAAAAAAGGAR